MPLEVPAVKPVFKQTNYNPKADIDFDMDYLILADLFGILLFGRFDVQVYHTDLLNIG